MERLRAEIQQGCANRQIDKLPAPFYDVPKQHSYLVRSPDQKIQRRY